VNLLRSSGRTTALRLIEIELSPVGPPTVGGILRGGLVDRKQRSHIRATSVGSTIGLRQPFAPQLPLDCLPLFFQNASTRRHQLGIERDTLVLVLCSENFFSNVP
jgi:hypothetical protein